MGTAHRPSLPQRLQLQVGVLNRVSTVKGGDSAADSRAGYTVLDKLRAAPFLHHGTAVLVYFPPELFATRVYVRTSPTGTCAPRTPARGSIVALGVGGVLPGRL